MIKFKQGDSIDMEIKFDSPVSQDVFVMFVGVNKLMVSTEDGTLEKVDDMTYTIKLTNKDTIKLLGDYKVEVYLKDGDYGLNAINSIDVKFYNSSVAKGAV